MRKMLQPYCNIKRCWGSPSEIKMELMAPVSVSANIMRKTMPATMVEARAGIKKVARKPFRPRRCKLLSRRASSMGRTINTTQLHTVTSVVVFSEA